ncbi:MAG: flagellar brake protein [Aquincola sp.]|nr:flagellar brake protein [Aquincola sp.]
MKHQDFQPTQPAPIETLTGRAIDEFRVSHPSEVISLLRRINEGNVLVQLCAPDGAVYACTLWAVDTHQRRLSFDADPKHPQVRSLLDAGEVTAMAYLDAIKLQFDLRGLMLVHGRDSSALQTGFPEAMYRFQRREGFRVKPRNEALAHLRHPSQPESALALRVLDVSVGGCALALPAQTPPIDAGAELPQVRLELDADTRFIATLHVQHVSGGFGSTAKIVRLGCAFGRLDGPAQRAVQRFVDVTQRRHKLLSI